ncbi:MAG: SGNH/GDSL hydrolase family protein [Oscillospiraceae bacterium]|nr:SGNH/GDSL hydrolase family protein [Oscillospiraceae bacterium]
MNEMKTLTMGGKTYDSFQDATARAEIAAIVNESGYELVGKTPVTLQEMSDIKITADGEVEYAIETPTVADFEQLLNDGKVALEKCSISKSKGYFEVVTTEDMTQYYQAWVGFVVDGLEIGKSYKLICNVDGLSNNQPNKVWHGSFTVWSGASATGSMITASHMPHTGALQITAQETSIYVRYYPATNNPNVLAGWIGNFNSFYVNRAEMSDEQTAIYSKTGIFEGAVVMKAVPPMAVVSATPSASVYRKASTDITLTQAGKPADAKATGDMFGIVEKRFPLWGKTIANFGDSIFGNARPPLDVSTFLANNTGATVYNCAFGGCRMAEHTGHLDAFSMYRLAYAIANNDYFLQDDALNYDDRVSYAEETLALIKSIDFANLDILTIAYGTNDFTSSMAIDNKDNLLDTTTVCGALRYSIETLLTAYPNLRIFVLLPTYRFWVDANNGNAFVNDSETYTNNRGKTLAEYSTAITEAAKAYNLPVIDNYTELGINKLNRYQYFSMADGTHHIEAGRKLIAKHLAHELW